MYILSQYMHGNLAVSPSQNQRVSMRRERSRVIVRKLAIPAKEKLLYLFVIVLCVVIAGAIIYNYAQIYEINTKIQQVEKEIETIDRENRTLMLSVRMLQDPKKLVEMGESLGFYVPNEESITQVTINQSQWLREERKVAAVE